MRKTDFLIILVLIFLIFSNGYAKPDLKFGSTGDNVYNASDNATVTETTIYDAVCGKYSPVNITIENDNSSDNTLMYEIFQVSITKPSSDWDYYILYKNEKYTGKWATEAIDKGSSENFVLYVKPPDSEPAETSSFKIVAKDSLGNVDAATVYVNVAKKESLDLILISPDNFTTGEYIYSTNGNDEKYSINIDPYNKYNFTFKVKNRGNIISKYKIKAESAYYDSDSVKFYSLEGNDVTDDMFQSKTEYLDNGSENSYSVEIIGNKIPKTGGFYIKLYDNNDNLVDLFYVEVTLLSVSNNVYIMPYVEDNDNITTVLALINDSNEKGNVYVNNSIRSSGSETIYEIEPKKIKFIEITEPSKLKINSENIIFAPFIIQFDIHYNVGSSIIPSNVDIRGKNIIMPLLVQDNISENSIIYINNLEKTTNNITLYLYSSEGDKITEKSYVLSTENYQIVNVSNLIGNDSSKIYWANIKGTKELSVYMINSFLNSYINTYGYKFRK